LSFSTVGRRLPGRLADRVIVDRIQAAFQAAGVGAEILTPWGGANWARRARQAVHSAADVVVAGGGDGTLARWPGAGGNFQAARYPAPGDAENISPGTWASP